MKFITTKSLNPSKIFKSKKSKLSRSTPSSSFSSSSDDLKTPTSVLPTTYSDDLKHAFNIIDTDGDGKVNKSDLESILTRIGPQSLTKDELDSMLSDVDRDGDGCITLEEFYAVGSAFAPPSCDSELRDTFDFFDSDRDGKISAEELFRVFETIGEGRCTLEECRRMIAGVDRNGDGFVCFDDFSRMMVLQEHDDNDDEHRLN